MSSSDLEKGAGVHNLPQQPQATRTHPQSGFLPSYEEHLNAELRSFPQAAAQNKLHPFDRIQEPAKKKKSSTRRCRTCWSAISALIFLIVSGITGSAVFLYRAAHLKKHDGNKVATPTSSHTLTLSKLTLTETTQTSMPPRSATTITVTPTTIITVPAATSTPPPVISTSTRIVTVTPSSAPTTSQPIATLTSTGLVSFTQSSAIESSLVTFSSETSPTPSTTSSSTEAMSSSTTTTPPPSTSPTTVVSVTTATATPSTSTQPPPPTMTPLKPGFCGVPGESCA